MGRERERGERERGEREEKREEKERERERERGREEREEIERGTKRVVRNMEHIGIIISYNCINPYRRVNLNKNKYWVLIIFSKL